MAGMSEVDVHCSRALPDRVVLLTGLSRRIGIAYGLANRLLADGATVFASGWVAHDAEMPWGADGQSVTESLGAPFDRFHYEQADLEDPAQPRRLVTACIERFGRIDAIVACHGRSSNQSLADVTPQELDRCWAANARSSVLFAQALLELRPPGPGGRLVLFTSGQHVGPMSNEIAYAVSKGAIHQMTASLADALADRGVLVNTINPGPVDTGYATGEIHSWVAAKFPAGRWGDPADVAKLVSWLVSDEGDWMTGQVLNLDGGFNLRR